MARVALNSALIVTETLALVDEQGIGATSMRAVAQRLGVRAMSLYRHVDSREELLDAVVERIVDELSADPDVPVTQADIGWQRYLDGLAHGVRRYARAHPRAFPLVSTRPAAAPWVNPPLRSLRWIECLLDNLADAGFTDDQILFTYRAFNSFLLGYLLLETSAMVIDDPKAGDGSFQIGSPDPNNAPNAEADVTNGCKIPKMKNVDKTYYPLIHRLRDGLTENRFEQEFAAGLVILLARIASHLESPSRM